MKKLTRRIATLIVLAALCSFMSISVFAADEKDAAPAKVTGLRQTEASDSSFKVTWATPAGNVKGYYSVQTSTDNVNWSNADESSIGCDKVINNLSNGQVMYVRVAAYSGYSWSANTTLGEYSDSLQVVTSPAKATGVIQTGVTADSVTIAWNPVPGAVSYRIHTDDDQKTVIAETAASSYTIGGLAPNMAGRFWVSAVSKSASGYIAESQLGYSWDKTCADCKTLPARMGSETFGIANFWSGLGEVNFTSAKPINADGTQIEVRTVAGNKSVWTTDSSSYYKYAKNKSLKYRCRAYVLIGGQRVYGPWSSYHYFATQNTQARTKSNTRKIYMSWKKVSGAANYTIYISKASDSGFKKVATVSKKKNSYTISKMGKKRLAKNETYYVRIIPKIKVGKKTYKSEVYSQASVTVY